ncbi:MAG: hypothetical protein A3K07_02290 [Candidatus Doudnabacteria bacterium RIFCSPHIGHO2_01_43_10]|nr:MAG: hypothetical protein A3K07_02290 [Candidatus Doudnabacteria bacterium RIFCSPHIGHO2_01_43_10]
MQIKSIYAAAKDTQTRPVLKTFSWRILATIITGIVVYLYTGKIGESSKITLTAAVILTVSYYLHERLWIWIRGRRN